MAEGVDSSCHALLDTIVDPGQDMELEALDTSYPQLSYNTSTSIDSYPEAYFPNDTLASQYDYPSPPATYNHRPHSYPDPLVQTTEQSAAYYTPSSANISAVRTINPLPTDGPNIAPSQTILQRKQESGLSSSSIRDDYRTQHEVGKSKKPAAPRRRQATIPRQDDARNKRRRVTQRAIQPAPNFLWDVSTPYVPGHTTGREDALQGLTDAVSAVVEWPSFKCDVCRKQWKSKSDLEHHKVTHDTEKRHRHKCPACETGFRYPKDVVRHYDTIHNKAQYPCADCHTSFSRKDNLERHLKSQVHIAASGATSLISDPRVSPAASTNAYEESSIVGASPWESQPLIQSYGYSAGTISLNQQSLSYLDLPRLLQPSQFSSASFTTGSIDDTFTTSEDISSWSEER